MNSAQMPLLDGYPFDCYMNSKLLERTSPMNSSHNEYIECDAGYKSTKYGGLEMEYNANNYFVIF